jgi:hypothetical protein
MYYRGAPVYPAGPGVHPRGAAARRRAPTADDAGRDARGRRGSNWGPAARSLRPDGVIRITVLRGATVTVE